MDSKKEEIVETIEMPKGLSVDLDEGWAKLIGRQSGDDPERAINEVIQNLIDSYADNIPWEERWGEISTSEKKYSDH